MNSKLYLLYLNLFFLLISAPAWSQVYPGDANNNGKVDNIDILYMGYAYGSFGPIHIEEAGIFPEWPQDFPDGVNYSYSDANGDGIIDFEDLLHVFTHYNEINSNVEPVDDVFALGTPDFDPNISLNEADLPEPLTEGGFFQIPISIGSEDNPIENINGLAFTIAYDTDYIQFVDFQFTAEWLDFDMENTSDIFSFQSFEGNLATGELDIALTRFGLNPISGHGEIGVMSIVIEDNLIGLLPSDSANIFIKLKEVKVIDEDFSDVPVVNDSIEVMVYHPNAITSIKEPSFAKDVRLFPNPAKDYIHVKAPVEIERIEIFNTLGQRILEENYDFPLLAKVDTHNLTEGIYLLQLYTSRGNVSRKITIENK